MQEPAFVGLIGGITDDLGDVRRHLGMRRMPTYLAIRGDRRYRWREAPLAVRPPAVVFAFPRLTRKPLSTLFCWCRQFLSSLQRGLVALSMKLGEYQDLYRKLGTVQDIDFLAENFGYDKELLLVVYTQRIVRDTTKKFYRVKAQARRLAFMWQNGTSLLEIARRFDFPPILTALMVLEQRRISRKNFWKMINDINGIKDKRLRRELEEVNRADIVYSPEGTARQYARGRWGEAKLSTWLNARGLQYETEKDLRAKYDKTPDILMHKPLEMNGSRKYWIESKATFGDPYEIRRHIKKQLQPYSDLFGDGAVVYWFGFVDDQQYALPEGVDIVSPTFFETPPVPFPYAPVGETRIEDRALVPDAVDLPE